MFLPFARQFHRLLPDDEGLVIGMCGAWILGQPTRSLCHFEPPIDLCKRVRFTSPKSSSGNRSTDRHTYRYPSWRYRACTEIARWSAAATARAAPTAAMTASIASPPPLRIISRR